MAKALLIAAQANFRDEELFHTKEELEKAGIDVTLASKEPGPMTGMLGGKANASLSISEANAEDYDAIIFVGGGGAQTFFNDSSALALAENARSQGKVLGAICIAPVVLANAGVLDGKRATVWDSDGSYTAMLESKGAECTGEDLTVDGNLVTANGPQAARSFGKKIAEMLR